MSEPVIKASEYLCDVCFGVSDLGGLHYFNGRVCKGTMTARYTHDDLVRAVSFARPAGRDCHGDLTSEQIVDRLTKGET